MTIEDSLANDFALRVLENRLKQHLHSEIKRLKLSGEYRLAALKYRNTTFTVEIQKDGYTLWTAIATEPGITCALEGGMGPTVWSKL